MEHINGNMNQTISVDNGDFIQIFNLRCRKELISAYMKHVVKDKDSEDFRCGGIKVLLQGGWIIGDANEEDTNEKIAHLDKIFEIHKSSMRVVE